MQTFAELAASRREWIDSVLKPWCAQASRKDLLAATQEWVDIAGNVDDQKTLWAWAWGRFPGLVHEDLGGIDETFQVTVTFNDGSKTTGFPDARESTDGHLVLLTKSSPPLNQSRQAGPFSIDDIVEVTRIGD